MLQTATNMAQIVDQQNQQIQYQFAPQMDQGQQQQQLIVQPQQIKQTIYPHQVSHSFHNVDKRFDDKFISSGRLTAALLPVTADSAAADCTTKRCEDFNAGESSAVQFRAEAAATTAATTADHAASSTATADADAAKYASIHASHVGIDTGQNSRAESAASAATTATASKAKNSK